jgi:hypothetical protein
MTARTSPAVASKRANQAARARFKAEREGRQVESAADHADRLLKILTPAAASDPAPDSLAYAKWVRDSFSERFMELCRAHPVRARRP